MSLPLLLASGATGLAVMWAWLWLRSSREARDLAKRLEVASRDLEHLQTSFDRFAPRQLVERIIASGVSIGGESKQVTVLFADLVGSTELSEQLSPDVLLRVLNGYLGRMARVIAEHRGHVSKFIGDGILALFGALEPNPWQANDAVHAALAMRVALVGYNRELSQSGLPVLRAGIGIHRGDAVAGVIGSDELMEFTVIGNNVNLAARIERLTRVHGVDILVTQAVRQALDPRFALRELPAVALDGIAEPVVTFVVEGFGGRT